MLTLFFLPLTSPLVVQNLLSKTVAYNISLKSAWFSKSWHLISKPANKNYSVSVEKKVKKRIEIWNFNNISLETIYH